MKPKLKDLNKAKENLYAAIDTFKACIADKYADDNEGEEVTKQAEEEQDRIDTAFAELKAVVEELLP